MPEGPKVSAFDRFDEGRTQRPTGAERATIEKNADLLLTALTGGRAVRRKAWPPGAAMQRHPNFGHLRRAPVGAPRPRDGFGHSIDIVDELLLLSCYACIWVNGKGHGEQWAPPEQTTDLAADDWEIL